MLGQMTQLDWKEEEKKKEEKSKRNEREKETQPSNCQAKWPDLA